MSSFDASHIFNVKGLVAVITGGGSGIGLMMAKALALNGAEKVYIVGRRKHVLEAAAKESPHGNIVPIVGDVTSKDSLQAVAKQISDEVGYVNLLIANSGVLGPERKAVLGAKTVEEFQAALWGQDAGEYTNTFEVNCTAAFFTAIAFLGLLSNGNKKGNRPSNSQIIITSSIAGFNRQVPGGYAYGQSKAAATAMTKQLATTLAPWDIKVNALAPGLFPSELAASLITPEQPPRERIPAQRYGREEDMAGAILFLTSLGGDYVSGNILVIDGGRVSVTPSSY